MRLSPNVNYMFKFSLDQKYSIKTDFRSFTIKTKPYFNCKNNTNIISKYFAS